MAIYDYKCSNCGKDFEYFHSRTDDKYAECPHCGAKETEEQKHEKQVSKGTSHVLKGGGWYRDGY